MAAESGMLGGREVGFVCASWADWRDRFGATLRLTRWSGDEKQVVVKLAGSCSWVGVLGGVMVNLREMGSELICYREEDMLTLEHKVSRPVLSGLLAARQTFLEDDMRNAHGICCEAKVQKRILAKRT